MSDVRSLEEVIAAASRQWQRMLDNGEYEGHTVNEVIAAAVREWCLAEPQIERVARQLMWNEDPYAKITGWAGLDAESQADYIERARAAFRAVIGDTP